MDIHVLRSPDAVDGGTATATGEGARATQAAPGEAAADDAPLPIGAHGIPDLRDRYSAGCGHAPLSDETARAMLGDIARFMWQIAMMTSGVLATVDVGKLREIVAADVALPAYIIDELGKITPKDRAPKPEQASDAEQAPNRDHRKNPRGRRHPLVALLILGVQASRLHTQITQGTNPEAHNVEFFGDRLTREAQVRYDREKAREPYNAYGS